MTRKERQLPDILNASRRRRIALGSGTSVQDVNMLLKQFRDMQKMMKQMGIMGGGKKNRRGRGGLGNLMNLFGGPGQ
jgi:signal recognition particle subunit SRP54